MEGEMEIEVFSVCAKFHDISENKKTGLNICSNFRDKSQSDNEDPDFKSTVEPLIVEKGFKSGLGLEDIQEITDTVHSLYDKRQLPISREEMKGLKFFEAEKLLPIEKEEESRQRLQNAKSAIYDEFSRRELVQSKDTSEIIDKSTKHDKFSGRELVQSKDTSEIIDKSTKHDKFSGRELVQSKDTSEIIDKSTKHDIFSRREPVSINATRSFLTKVTANMELSIEKLPEQMAIMAVTVDHEKLPFGILIKQMQDYPQLTQNMYERFLFQKVMQRPSKTVVTQKLVELLIKQPHELKQHFFTINPDGLTDGHVYLFDMSMSALVPALTFPQQSETMLSYVRSIDSLLSFSDPFSEVCVQYTWDMM